MNQRTGQLEENLVQGLCEQENCKDSCVIFMGSPPQTTTINTRHTPITNNYYNHSQHHQQHHQPSQPSQLAESTSHSQPIQPRACVLALCACAWLRPLSGIRATSASTATQRQPASQPLRNTSATPQPSKQAPRHTMPSIRQARR